MVWVLTTVDLLVGFCGQFSDNGYQLGTRLLRVRVSELFVIKGYKLFSKNVLLRKWKNGSLLTKNSNAT